MTQTAASLGLSRLPVSLRLLLPALILAAFLTETKFIPALANNVGFFEILGLVIIVLFFTVYREQRLHWKMHARTANCHCRRGSSTAIASNVATMA